MFNTLQRCYNKWVYQYYGNKLVKFVKKVIITEHRPLNREDFSQFADVNRLSLDAVATLIAIQSSSFRISYPPKLHYTYQEIYGTEPVLRFILPEETLAILDRLKMQYGDDRDFNEMKFNIAFELINMKAYLRKPLK